MIICDHILQQNNGPLNFVQWIVHQIEIKWLWKQWDTDSNKALISFLRPLVYSDVISCYIKHSLDNYKLSDLHNVAKWNGFVNFLFRGSPAGCEQKLHWECLYFHWDLTLQRSLMKYNPLTKDSCVPRCYISCACRNTVVQLGTSMRWSYVRIPLKPNWRRPS